MQNRPSYLALWKDLSRTKKMVFLAGPRQSGKTTLAQTIAAGFKTSTIFNWDYPENKRVLIKKPDFFKETPRQSPEEPLVVFDEIHKFRGWKNYLKGTFDHFHSDYRFLVLGSGRLNVYRKGGDSLAGRYGLMSLWPFTVSELVNRRRSWEEFRKDPLAFTPDPSAGAHWDSLERLSGFPEPYLSGRIEDYRRWSQAYHQQLVREDIRDLSGIREVELAATLFALLPSRVSSPLALQNLAEDLQVSHTAIRSWLDVLESLYLIFRLKPWSKKISRSLGQQKKLYLMDYVQIASEDARFENMVAVELWRAIHSWNEWGWGSFELRYLRNTDKEEVDFLITNQHVPFLLVESILNDEQLAAPLRKFQTLLHVPAIQLVRKPGVWRQFANGTHPVLIVTAADWLSGLP